MWFDNLQRAYKARDFINMLFVKHGILVPVVSVHRTLTGFKVAPIDRGIKVNKERKYEHARH